MKKLPLLLAALLLAAAALAQTTTLQVALTTQREAIKAGPYARFAQKYLGVVAPLADRTTTTITAATLAALQSGEPSASPVAAPPPASIDFPELPVDKRDLTPRSLDEAAREAALTIFSLRKARVELITGMAGENVFGEGMRAALDEFSRLEAEYTALFLGKKTIQTALHTRDVVPARGETQRVVARFLDGEGLLASDDLTGEPIVLEMKVVGDIAAPAPTTGRPSRNAPATQRTLLPAQVDCRLSFGAQTLASGRFAVSQMGVWVDVPR